MVYTGLRPGEKLFEEPVLSAIEGLFGEGEDYVLTGHEKIYVCRNGCAVYDLGFATACPGVSGISDSVDELVAAAGRGDAAAVRRRLVELVPEYQGTGVRRQEAADGSG